MAVLAFNFLGDGLRDAADPYEQLRRQPTLTRSCAVGPRSLDRLHLRTHILHAVRDVSFDLQAAARTLCLVGESGSGKSVTARALLRIVDKPGRIVGGTILLPTATADDRHRDARPRSRDDPRDPRPPHRPDLPGADERRCRRSTPSAPRSSRRCGCTATLDKARRASAPIELLRQVEIPNPEAMVDRYTFEFSGGMRQRAMIAMALAGNPDILIADEPTTALDVTTQAEILDLIKRLQVERGMAMLLITHDMGIVAEVADEVAVMRFGRIVERGPVDAIFHRAEPSLYAAQLLASTLKLEQAAACRSPRRALPAPVLSVRNLGKIFGGARPVRGKTKFAIRAVDDVSFDLYPGENLGIVGESGSGKTTLGRLILRTIEPSEGRSATAPATAASADVTALDKRGLAAVPPRRPPGLPGSVRLAQSAHDRARDHRRSAASSMARRQRRRAGGQGRRAHAPRGPRSARRWSAIPHAFSGGQRQRIGIARALALDPESSSPTRRPRRSTCRSAARSSTFCSTSRSGWASASSSSPTTSRWSAISAIASR